MADIAQTAPSDIPGETRRFEGSVRNMVPGVALLVAGLLAPTMGLTNVYFARALAWVFVIWGFFFLFVSLLDVVETWEISDNALLIRNPLRIWERNKEWAWDRIVRVELLVKRSDAEPSDAELRIHFSPPGEGSIEREDRDYDPALARMIVERAKLKPDGATPADLAQLPAVATTYVWK